MKTLLVLSDTHHNQEEIKKLLQLFRDCDYIFHLGDNYSDMQPYEEEFSDKLIRVKGNCDVSLFKSEGVIQIEDVKVFYAHGDRYRVKSTLYPLFARAKELDCKLALYGHTHVADITSQEDVTLVNPGSLSFSTPQKSVAFIVINGDKITATINKSVFF